MNSKQKFINEMCGLIPGDDCDYSKGFREAIEAVASLVKTSTWGPSEMVYPSDIQMLNLKVIDRLKETIKEQEATIAKLQAKLGHPPLYVVNDGADAFSYLVQGLKAKEREKIEHALEIIDDWGLPQEGDEPRKYSNAERAFIDALHVVVEEARKS